MSIVRRALVLILVALSLGACDKPRDPVRIGLLVWPPYELAYLARARSYYDQSAIELVDYVTPAEMVRSYRFGLIDAMFTTSQFALANTDTLAASRIVYAIDYSSGGDTLLAHPDIERLADLEGMRVGMEAGPLGAYVVARAFAGTGLSRDDINIVFVDTADQKSAFESDELDAVATYEPTRTKLLQQGARELFNSKAIPLEIIDVIIVKDHVIAERSSDLANFVQGVDRALQQFRAEPEKAAEIMVTRERLSIDEFLLAMDGTHLFSLEDNRKLLSGEDPRLLEGLATQREVMEEAGLLEREPVLEEILDASVVEAATQ